MVEADSAKRKFVHVDGDHLTMLNAYNAFEMKQYSSDFCWENFLNYRALMQTKNVRNQLQNMIVRNGLELISSPPTSPKYYENIKKCILSGFFTQTAHLERAGHYLTLKDDQVTLAHPSTSLDSKP
mmetsp:Transcript_17720/g.29985  ORF Transcript_17720/g.29985 Transcript_17720/m.29985 type:complete len:126 (+) Transcript_17720:1868-2245(+)